MHRLFKKKVKSNSNDVIFAVSNENKELQDKPQVRDSLQILLQTLSWLGIAKVGNLKSSSSIKKILRFTFPFLAHLIALDVIFVCIFHIKYSDVSPQVISSYIFVTVFALLLWYSLYIKGESLKNVFSILIVISEKHKVSNKPSSFSLTFLLTFNVLLALIYSSSFVFLPTEIDYMCTFYFYGIQEMCVQTFPNHIYIFLRAIYIRMPIFFNNLINLVYCCLCYRCTTLLRNYANHIRKIDFMKTDCLSLRHLAIEYQNLRDIVTKLENAFSLSSLIILIIDFIQAFMLLARFLLYFEEEVSLFYMIEHLCVGIPAASFIFVMPAYAAQVSKEMMQIEDNFHIIYGKMLFNSVDDTDSENLLIISTLKSIIPVQMSGWEMVEYTGGTIPAVLGTLITYGLLILNLNSEK